MAEFDFPSTGLTDGQTHTENGVTFVWDNTNGAWKKNPASAIKGEPGDAQKGQKGEAGQATSKGDKGQKGQPSSDSFELLTTHVVNPSNNTTEVAFTGIPAEAYEITLMFAGVSATDNDNFKIQLGTASAYINTNYYSLSQNEGGGDELEATDSFVIRSDGGNRQKFGSMVIRKASDAHYVQTGQFAVSPNKGGNQTYGSVTTGSATVTRLRVILSGTNTFDAGSISLSYKSDGGGDKGEQGDKGVQGDKGIEGDKGLTGTDAEKGQKGEAGTSVKGEPGASTKGEPGASTKGEPGDDGDSVKGDKGEEGGAGSSVPSGGIILWSGAANKIGQSVASGGTGTGWVLCDGSNNTPDLRGKFVVGYSNTDGLFDVDDTGGSKDATLVSHSHTINNHTHSFSASTTGGNHNHTYVDQYVVINNGYRPWPANNNDCAARNVNTGGSGSHSHSISGTTGNPSNRGTNSQGSSATNANLPPYYALCYIMKT